LRYYHAKKTKFPATTKACIIFRPNHIAIIGYAIAFRRLHGRLINLGVRSIGPETTPPEGVATIANAAVIDEG
jgi:hypothetical protein